MLCPMKFIVPMRNARNEYVSDAHDCEQSACAWWDSANGNCAVATIAYCQSDLSESIELQRTKGKSR